MESKDSFTRSSIVMSFSNDGLLGKVFVTERNI